MSKTSAYLMAALAFALGFVSGNYAAKKGCPPVPVPAAAPSDDGKPVAVPPEPFVRDRAEGKR